MNRRYYLPDKWKNRKCDHQKEMNRHNRSLHSFFGSHWQFLQPATSKEGRKEGRKEGTMRQGKERKDKRSKPLGGRWHLISVEGSHEKQRAMSLRQRKGKEFLVNR